MLFDTVINSIFIAFFKKWVMKKFLFFHFVLKNVTRKFLFSVIITSKNTDKVIVKFVGAIFLQKEDFFLLEQF